ncbi:MAG: hypothetical protein AB7S68_24210 [Polyangiaceae bacterium]
MKRWLALTLLSVVSAGCDEEKPAQEKAAASATADAPKAEAEPSAAPKEAEPEKPKGPRMDSDTVLGIPTEKSKEPTSEEWDGAKALESVPGNVGPTACEVKVVREWLSITCKAFGGDDPKKPKFKPEKSEVVSGKTAEMKTAVKGNEGNVILPLREDINVSALISFSSGGPKKAITVEWPKGTDGPTLKTRTGM